MPMLGKYEKVRGIDSGVAAILANDGQKFDPFSERPKVEELDFSATSAPVHPILFRNNLYDWKNHVKMITV